MVLLYLRRSPLQLLVVTSDPYSLLCGPRDTTLALHQADPRNPIESKGMQSRMRDDERIDRMIDDGMIYDR
jgi:hypothetical protein